MPIARPGRQEVAACHRHAQTLKGDEEEIQQVSYPYVTDMLNAAFGTEWSLPIPTFGFIVAMTMVLGTRAARAEVKKQAAQGRLPPSAHLLVPDTVMISALAGLLGARLFHILDFPQQFLADPVAMIFTRGGFSIYGGLCFGLATGILILRRRRVPVIPMLDAVAPAMMLAYAIGRIGCQVSGDGDWGIAADLALKPAWLPTWLWAQTYEGNVLGVAIAQPGVYPAPLYESAACFTLFGLLAALQSKPHRAGYLFSIYLLLAGFERMLIEKIRIDPEHALLGARLTQAEIISLALIVMGLAGALMTMRAGKRWPRILFSAGVLAALSACVPF
jgi:phosphatidylglycerol:prolipoprotein diacylglycerol transferase